MAVKDEVADAILAIKADLDQRHGENITRAQVSEKLLNELMGSRRLIAAFPEEDPLGTATITMRSPKRWKRVPSFIEVAYRVA